MIAEAHRMRPGTGLPVFGVHWTRHYQGGERQGDTYVYSWETAQKRWRTVTLELGWWRVAFKLWKLPSPRGEVR